MPILIATSQGVAYYLSTLIMKVLIIGDWALKVVSMAGCANSICRVVDVAGDQNEPFKIPTLTLRAIAIKIAAARKKSLVDLTRVCHQDL